MSCNADGLALPCDMVPSLIGGGAAVPCPDSGCDGVTAHDIGDGVTSLYQKSYTNILELNCDSFTDYADYRNHCQWSNVSLKWIADWDVPLSDFANASLFPKDRPGIWQQSAKTGESAFIATAVVIAAVPAIGGAGGAISACNPGLNTGNYAHATVYCRGCRVPSSALATIRATEFI
jgi:hypothetical protein